MAILAVMSAFDPEPTLRTVEFRSCRGSHELASRGELVVECQTILRVPALFRMLRKLKAGLAGTIRMKYFWSALLIGLGVSVLVLSPFEKLDAYLQGLPDRVLTLILLGLAALTVAVALVARPSLKALLVLWIVAP